MTYQYESIVKTYEELDSILNKRTDVIFKFKWKENIFKNKFYDVRLAQSKDKNSWFLLIAPTEVRADNVLYIGEREIEGKVLKEIHLKKDDIDFLKKEMKKKGFKESENKKIVKDKLLLEEIEIENESNIDIKDSKYLFSWEVSAIYIR